MCARSNGKTRSEEGWLSVGDVARGLGITVRGLHKLRQVLADRLSDDDVVSEGRGKTTWIYMPHLIEAYVAHRLERDASPDSRLKLEKQELTLQRERNRLKREEIELDRLRGNTLSREEVRDTWNLVAGHVRRGLISLERRCGSEAHGIMDKVLRDAERAMCNGSNGDYLGSERVKP